MNWLDSAISFISPKIGAERLAWRQELEYMRSYDAGGYGRLQSNWHAQNQSAEMDDKYSRDTLRARARDLERNSDIANSILKAFKRGVVGKGINVQAKTDDEELNSQIEELFNGQNIEIEFVSHTKLKEQTKHCKAVIRTGETTPYANIILQAGCIFS